MSVSRRLTSVALALAGAVALLSACTSSTGPGQLEVTLNGASASAAHSVADQVVVDVTKVTAHSASAGWVTVGPATSPTTVDVLALQTYAEPLGLVNLPAGKVTQIRLFTAPDGNYVVPTGSTTQEPLVVPSGTETGIKIVGPWDVPACTRLTVTLDFDGKNSILYHQADGRWILRPVIHPSKADGTPISCEEEEPGQACDVEIPCPEGQVCVSGTCVPGTPGATGSACTAGTQCLTGNCSAGVCAPGGPGAPCNGPGDCQSAPVPLVCVAGSCQPTPQ